ncbi:MAG: hypothetical protein KatS3mg105_1301 [Gemmatales bacterium]|nr:MAG: hypothetical protein KatS3mg105_1301 [Gemmatales bacterium]
MVWTRIGRWPSPFSDISHRCLSLSLFNLGQKQSYLDGCYLVIGCYPIGVLLGAVLANLPAAVTLRR